MHRSTLYSRIEYIERIDRERDIHQEGVALQDMLSRCDRILGFQDFRTLHVRLSLGCHYLKRQEYIQARKAGQDAIDHAQGLQPVSDEAYNRAGGLYIVAVSQYALGEAPSAEENLCEAMKLRLFGCGAHDGRAILWLLKLEVWMVEQGRYGLCCSGSMPEEGDTGVNKSNVKEMSGPNIDRTDFVSRKVIF